MNQRSVIAGIAAVVSLAVVGGVAWQLTRETQEPFEVVMLISMDTIRVDHLEFYGYERSTNPFMASIAEKSVIFEDAMSSASFTAPSHASMLTGRYPYDTEVFSNWHSMSADVPTIASLWGEKGWQSGAFLTAGFLANIAPTFDTVNADKPQRARRAAQRAMDWLDGLDPNAPIFTWVHMYDAHKWKRRDQIRPAEMQRFLEVTPKASGDELFSYVEAIHAWEPGRYDEDRQDRITDIDHYDLRIRQVDRQIERLVAHLDALDKPYLLIITTDHGEGLGSHGYEGHGHQIWEEQVRVPLLFFASDGRFEPHRVKAPVHHIDLLPTLAELTDTPVPAGTTDADARSLVPLLEGSDPSWDDRVRFAHRRADKDRRMFADIWTVRQGDKKMFVYHDETKKCFDLASDPQEQTALPDGSCGGIEAASAPFADHVAKARERFVYKTAKDVDADLAAELRALGYAE